MISRLKAHLSEHGFVYRGYSVTMRSPRNWCVHGPNLHLSILRTVEDALEAIDAYIDTTDEEVPF